MFILSCRIYFAEYMFFTSVVIVVLGMASMITDLREKHTIIEQTNDESITIE